MENKIKKRSLLVCTIVFLILFVLFMILCFNQNGYYVIGAIISGVVCMVSFFNYILVPN